MYVDNNGIVRFENLDDITPLQTKLNTALQSVSDAITEIHTNYAVTTVNINTTDAMTGSGLAVRWGPMVALTGRFDGSLPASGTLIARIPAGFRPAASLKTLVGGSSATNLGTRVLSITFGGDVYYLGGGNPVGTSLDLDGVVYLGEDYT